MERMTIDEIARAVGCPGSYPGAVDVISTDSRSLPEGCLFVALEGERFDGHDFIPAALRSGAAAAVAHERRDYGPGTVLYVKNTQRALMEIAKAYRAKFSIRCVGVTGSVGKTTTKEMIADVLSCAYRTLRTEGNLNNEIGLPKTLFPPRPHDRGGRRRDGDAGGSGRSRRWPAWQGRTSASSRISA